MTLPVVAACLGVLLLTASNKSGVLWKTPYVVVVVEAVSPLCQE